MLRQILEKAARQYRGDSYRIDPDIPESALIGFGLRRMLGRIRSLVHGRGFRKAFLSENVKLRNRRFISFGNGVTLGRGVSIDGLSRSGVRLGHCVNIGAYSIIEATGVLSKLGEGCSIGKNSALGPFSYIGAAGGVTIGEDVIMGQRVSFHAENHVHDRTDIPIRMQGVKRKGIVIGDDCWIGSNSIFLDGAHVGRGCVIGAGSVVRGEIPPYSVAAGVPARVIRSRKMDENAS